MMWGVVWECGGAEGIAVPLDSHGLRAHLRVLPLLVRSFSYSSGALPVTRYNPTAAALLPTQILLPLLLHTPCPFSSKPVDTL